MATSNPIEPIQPINIPSAAGVNYGEGDVRHFAQGDAVSVPGISNPTRQLAERDNMLAEKLNQVIAVVNNQEQFVPLPIVRTIVPPNDQTTALNYRIPSGFESRVLNAVVSSSPTSTDIELDIYYNASFGGSTGTQVVTTTTEFSGGVDFYQAGEFIVALKNKSGVSLEIVASVLLTLRPLGSEGTLLVGSVVQGKKGDTGQTGPPGPPGPAGSGGVSTPGMSWTGSWTNGASYQVGDTVRYDLDGVGNRVSSFICVSVDNPATSLNSPGDYLVSGNPWEAVALGGPVGATGAAGGAGPSGDVTTFSALETYTYGTFVAGTPYVGDSYFGNFYNSNYSGGATVYAAGQSGSFAMRETFFGTTSGVPLGFTYLSATLRKVFTGWGTISLPKLVYGAQMDYTNTQITCTIMTNGTVQGGVDNAISYAHPSYQDKFVVAVLNAQPTPVAICLTGMGIVY